MHLFIQNPGLSFFSFSTNESQTLREYIKRRIILYNSHSHKKTLTLLSLFLMREALLALSLSQPPNLEVRTIVGIGDEEKLEGSLVLREERNLLFTCFIG